LLFREVCLQELTNRQQDTVLRNGIEEPYEIIVDDHQVGCVVLPQKLMKFLPYDWRFVQPKEDRPRDLQDLGQDYRRRAEKFGKWCSSIRYDGTRNLKLFLPLQKTVSIRGLAVIVDTPGVSGA